MSRCESVKVATDVSMPLRSRVERTSEWCAKTCSVKRWPWQVWLIIIALAGVAYVFVMVLVVANGSD